MSIRGEMYGPKGFAKFHRKKEMPGTRKMAIIAQKRFAEELGEIDNHSVDDALEKLLVIEFEEYINRKDKLTESLLTSLDSVKEGEYPTCKQTLDKFKTLCEEDPLTAWRDSGVSEVVEKFMISQRQSGVTRAGTSLELHIKFLLEKKGINKFQYQKTLTSGHQSVLVDFIFPSIEHYADNPLDCLACACQTTSNDRFRMSEMQLNKGLRKFILTAIGCDNFSDALQADSLTENKLTEVAGEGCVFVILESGMDDRLSESPTVITYEEFFEELERLGTIWP